MSRIDKASIVIADLARRMKSSINKSRVMEWITTCFQTSFVLSSAVIQAADNPSMMNLDEWLEWCKETIDSNGLPIREGEARMVIKIRGDSTALGHLIDYAKAKAGVTAATRNRSETSEDMNTVYKCLTDKGAERAIMVYGNKKKRPNKVSLIESAYLYFMQNGEEDKANKIKREVQAIQEGFVFRSSSNSENSLYTANRQHTWLFHQLAVMIHFAKNNGVNEKKFINLCCEAAASANLGKGSKTTELGIFKCGIKYKITTADDLNISPVCLTVRRIIQACGMVAVSEDMPAPMYIILSRIPTSKDWNLLSKAWIKSERMSDMSQQRYLKDDLAHICNYWFTTKGGDYAVNWLKGSFLSVEFRQDTNEAPNDSDSDDPGNNGGGSGSADSQRRRVSPSGNFL